MTPVSDNYLDKVRFAVRRASKNEMVDGELTDLIQQCRENLVDIGVERQVAEDEDDVRVLGCVRCYARWQFGIGGDDAARNRDDYLLMADTLRRAVPLPTMEG